MLAGKSWILKTQTRKPGAASSLIMLGNDDNLRAGTTPLAEIRLSCLDCHLPQSAFFEITTFLCGNSKQAVIQGSVGTFGDQNIVKY